MKYTEEELATALRITSHKKEARKNAGLMLGMLHGYAEKVANHAVSQAVSKGETGEQKGGFRLSATETKCKGKLAFAATVDSTLHRAQEQARYLIRSITMEVINELQMPEEEGITALEFMECSKEMGCIPAKFRSEVLTRDGEVALKYDEAALYRFLEHHMTMVQEREARKAEKEMVAA